MQIIKAVIIFALSINAFAYDCKKTELKKVPTSVEEFGKQDRQILFEGLLYELTSPTLPKSPEKARMIADYLEGTEVNQTNRAFLKLLMYSSDLEKEKAVTLKLKEICEINEKAKNLKK